MTSNTNTPGSHFTDSTVLNIRSVQRDPTTSRTRTLSRWTFVSSPWGSKLQGLVTQDTEGDFSDVAMRLTTTSPIKQVHVAERYALTESGSKYTLLPLADSTNDLPHLKIPPDIQVIG